MTWTTRCGASPAAVWGMTCENRVYQDVPAVWVKGLT